MVRVSRVHLNDLQIQSHPSLARQISMSITELMQEASFSSKSISIKVFAGDRHVPGAYKESLLNIQVPSLFGDAAGPCC